MPYTNLLVKEILPSFAANLAAICNYLKGLLQANNQLSIEDVYSIFYAFTEYDYDYVIAKHPHIKSFIISMYQLCYSAKQATLPHGQVVNFTNADITDTTKKLLSLSMEGLLIKVCDYQTAKLILQNHTYIPSEKKPFVHTIKETAKGVGSVIWSPVTTMLAVGSAALNPKETAKSIGNAASQPVKTITSAASGAYHSVLYEIEHHPAKAFSKVITSLLFWANPIKSPPSQIPGVVSYSVGSSRVPNVVTYFGTQGTKIMTQARAASAAAEIGAVPATALGAVKVVTAVSNGVPDLNLNGDEQPAASVYEINQFMDIILGLLKRDGLITDAEMKAMRVDRQQMAADADVDQEEVLSASLSLRS